MTPKRRRASFLRTTAPLDGVAILFSDTPKPPLWMAHVNAILKAPAPVNALSQAPSALVLVKRKSAAFVLTFGHAWQKLRQTWLEPDFGRHIVLNLIKRNELVEVRSEQVFARRTVASGLPADERLTVRDEIVDLLAREAASPWR
jgi:uncharacterized protein (TIGR04141 family)